MTEIIPLSLIAPVRLDALLDAAFGMDRHGRTAYLLRKGLEPVPELSFAAVDGEELLGVIQCWPIALIAEDGATTAPLTLVGPVAVQPGLQRGGIGKAMMTHMLSAAQAEGHDALVMIGDPEYYERFFGFTSRPTQYWQLPGPVERHRLLALISRRGGVPERGQLGRDPAFASQGIPA